MLGTFISDPMDIFMSRSETRAERMAISETPSEIDKDFFSGILRIDVDQRAGSFPPNPHPASSTNYTVPAETLSLAPRVSTRHRRSNQVRTEFWAVGLRNPWRFSFDSPTGRLYCGDVGQGRREEIDLIVRGGNYGWNYREGSGPSYIRSPPDGITFDEPILDYGRDSGGCVIGGVVYRARRFPHYSGSTSSATMSAAAFWRCTSTAATKRE